MIHKKKPLLILGLLLVLFAVRPLMAQEALVTTVPDDHLMNIEGNWFSCEFAHSQVPPEDDCKMFDDDGFSVSLGQIHHIKVTNSRETGCRHERYGQCFERTREGIVVSKDPVGTIRATMGGFAIKYWGCTQEYTMDERGKYFEIAPTGRRCLWTREKRYFVARYRGQLEVANN